MPTGSGIRLSTADAPDRHYFSGARRPGSMAARGAPMAKRPAKRFFMAGEDQGLHDDEDGDIELPMTFGKRPRPQATTEGERGRKTKRAKPRGKRAS